MKKLVSLALKLDKELPEFIEYLNTLDMKSEEFAKAIETFNTTMVVMSNLSEMLRPCPDCEEKMKEEENDGTNN